MRLSGSKSKKWAYVFDVALHSSLFVLVKFNCEVVLRSIRSYCRCMKWNDAIFGWNPSRIHSDSAGWKNKMFFNFHFHFWSQWFSNRCSHTIVRMITKTNCDHGMIAIRAVTNEASYKEARALNARKTSTWTAQKYDYDYERNHSKLFQTTEPPALEHPGSAGIGGTSPTQSSTDWTFAAVVGAGTLSEHAGTTVRIWAYPFNEMTLKWRRRRVLNSQKS